MGHEASHAWLHVTDTRPDEPTPQRHIRERTVLALSHGCDAHVVQRLVLDPRFKEGDVFIAYVPQLDVSSCGDTALEGAIRAAIT